MLGNTLFPTTYSLITCIYQPDSLSLSFGMFFFFVYWVICDHFPTQLAVSMERFMKFIASNFSIEVETPFHEHQTCSRQPRRYCFLSSGLSRCTKRCLELHSHGRIEPEHDMPLGVVLLADKDYGDVVPLLTPLRAAKIRRMPLRYDHRRAHKCNCKHVIVELTIKYFKTFQAVGNLCRLPRWFQPFVAQLLFLRRETLCYLTLFRQSSHKLKLSELKKASDVLKVFLSLMTKKCV